MGSMLSMDADGKDASKELPVWKEAVVEECFGGKDLANGDTFTRENTMRGYTMGERTMNEATFKTAQDLSNSHGNIDPTELS